MVKGLRLTVWRRSSPRRRFASRSLHDQNDRAIRHPGQVAERVLDVFPRTELAGPASAGQLSGRVLGHIGESEQCDLLIPRFELILVAFHVAESGKGISEGGDGFGPIN